MVAPTHLKSLQALELTIRAGSMIGAAEQLGITPAAVGQRVKALEDYLGVELLTRGRSGIRPNEAVRAALPHLKAAFIELDAAARELDLQRGQELHISSASDFVELWLDPRLGQYQKVHPNVRFCINGRGDAPLRLGRADIEINFGPRTESDLVDSLFPDFVLPISSPGNCTRTEALPTRSRLEGFPLLHLDFYKDDPAGISWPNWISRNSLNRTCPDRGIRFRRITAVLDAVLADAGFSLAGLALLEQHLRRGEIALPFAPDTAIWTQWGFTARYRDDWHTRPQVRKFREWLRSESANTWGWLRNLAA
jgi:LysR family transcriptional regulator, glycine cleavage system transcriptional activator